MVVVLRGRGGGRVECSLEGVPATDRAGLEAQLIRPGKVAVRGRFAGTNSVPRSSAAVVCSTDF